MRASAAAANAALWEESEAATNHDLVDDARSDVKS